MLRVKNVLTTLATAAALAFAGAAIAQGGGGSGTPSNNTVDSGPKAGSLPTTNSGTMDRSTGTSGAPMVAPAQGPNNPSPAGPRGVGSTGPMDRQATGSAMSGDTGTRANTDSMAPNDTVRPMNRRAPRSDRN